MLAHVYAARHVLPAMVERGRGHFLVTASAAGLLTEMDTAPYAVTKHGSVALAEWLAIRYGGAGVGFSCLCPQAVRTAMTAGLGEDSSTLAAGAMIEPEQVADAVVEALADGRFLILPHPEVADVRTAPRRGPGPLARRHAPDAGRPGQPSSRRELTAMEFAYDERTEELRARVNAFMDEFVYPAEATLAEQLESASGSLGEPPVIADAAGAGAAAGLWNLFLAGHEGGAGLTNLQYAPLAEIMGRSPELAPRAFNCSAPDTGNMELLAEFGTAAQRDALAQTVAGRADPLGVLHDRAGRRLLRRHQHRHPDHPRRRRVRHQRAQVVVVRRDEPGLRHLHRDGQDRPVAPTGTASRA